MNIIPKFVITPDDSAIKSNLFLVFVVSASKHTYIITPNMIAIAIKLTTSRNMLLISIYPFNLLFSAIYARTLLDEWLLQT